MNVFEIHRKSNTSNYGCTRRGKRFNHSYVGTEHILLGIISDKENIVVKALTGLDIQTDEIRKLVEERLELNSAGKAIQIYRLLNKPSRFYQMLGMKPRKLGHNYVNVEHLFLSIFRDPTNIAAKVYKN